MTRRPLSTSASSKRKSQVNRRSSFLVGPLDTLNVFNQKIYDCVQRGDLGEDQMHEIRGRLDGFMHDVQRSTGTATQNPQEDTATTKLLVIKKKLLYERELIKAELDSGTKKYLQLVSLTQDEIAQGEDVGPINERLIKIQDLSLKTDTLVDHYDYIKQVLLPFCPT